MRLIGSTSVPLRAADVVGHLAASLLQQHRIVTSLNKSYPRAKFDFAIIDEARAAIAAIAKEHVASHPGISLDQTAFTRRVTSGSETWDFDTDEEFAAEYRKDGTASFFSVQPIYGSEYSILQVTTSALDTSLLVRAPARSDVLRVIGVFEKHLKGIDCASPASTTAGAPVAASTPARVHRPRTSN